MSDALTPATPARRARRLRWAIGVMAAVFTGMGLVLMFFLAQATNNRALYERNYTRLFTLNVVVATLLGLVIVWVGLRLWQRLRQGKFGSRLLIKLATIFALVGVVPGMLVYTVSYQFVARSIESWFDVKVEGALNAGLNLGRATLDSAVNDQTSKARAASQQLAQLPDAGIGLVMDRMREQLGANNMALWSASGQLIASASTSRFVLSPERPSAQQLRQARTDRVVAHIEGLDEAAESGAAQGTARVNVKVIAVVFRSGFELTTEPRFLEITQALPAAVVDNALAVQEVHREYQERALARDGLRRMYIGTLTLSLFLAVFGAVLLAVLFGTQLARPLLVLAEGVRQVAAGDLRPTQVSQARDELGGLTRSFADMTQQLADARHAVEQSMGQVDAARENLQTILDNLSSGVIVLDSLGIIRSINPGATRVLRAPMGAFIGQAFSAVPGLLEFSQAVQQRFGELEVDHTFHGLDHWQSAFELHAAGGGIERNAVHVVARGAILPGETRLVVLDDITDIVSAQRLQAWGEVARRLAHEIKNPLTPIQLSAERLEKRLSGKVAPSEEAVLAKSVRTIVDQVDAMKRLVNEFRDYARLPSAQLQPLNLNALLQEVLSLYEFETDSLRVQTELDWTCQPIWGDAQQLRQVLHNLLQNAQDATEGRGPVLIRTRLADSGRRVRLTVQDSGSGFAAHILQRAFEPYVTTKSKGTGLGLAVVKKIADEHNARIELSNRTLEGAVVGAQVSLSFAVASPQEKDFSRQG